MTDDLDDILGLAKNEQPELPPDASMKELSELCTELANLRIRIEKGEELLAGLKREEIRLSQEVVPSKLDEVGFTKVVLPTGQSISYKHFYSGKIIPESEPLAFNWLEENGHGGVIKGQAIIPYRRNERDEILEMMKEIKAKYGKDAEIKLSVHHSTLRALVREVTENGETFPPDLFTIFIGRQTEIK